MQNVKGPNETNATRKENGAPTKPSKSSSAGQMAIDNKNKVPSVTIHVIGDGLSFEDEQRIEAGKSVKFKKGGKLGKNVKFQKGVSKARKKSMAALLYVLNATPSKSRPPAMGGKDIKELKHGVLIKERKPREVAVDAERKSDVSEKYAGSTFPSAKDQKDGKAAIEMKQPKVTAKAGGKAAKYIGVALSSKDKQLQKAGKTAKDQKGGKSAKEMKQPKVGAKSSGVRRIKRKLRGDGSVVATSSENEFPDYETTDDNVTDSETIEIDSKVEKEIAEEEILDLSEIEVYDEDELEGDLAYEELSISSDDSDNLIDDVPQFYDYEESKKRIDKLKANVIDYTGLPDIDEISIDESILNFMPEIEKQLNLAVELGGEETESVQEEHENDIFSGGDEEEGGEADEEASLEETSISEYEFESISEEDQIAKTDEKQVSDENLFEVLIQLDAKPYKVEEIEFEVLARLAERYHLEKDTKAFLEVLIEKVMETADYVDPNDLMRQKLNKVKLFRQLLELMIEKDTEIKFNDFLVKKCAEYYRIQKRYITITPEPDEATLERDQTRYHEVIDELDKIMVDEVERQELIFQKENDAQEGLTELQNEYKSNLENLNELIFRTFARNDKASDHLKNFIQKQIRDMTELRKEISSKRSVLIRVQHTLSRLSDKKFAMDNFGPNLTIRTYENLRDDISQLNLSLDDRSSYLFKLHKRYHMSTNVLAHFRQNKIMLYETIKNKLETLQLVLFEKDDLRHYIHSLKKKRIPVKKKILEINFKFGLLNKPALCFDYDHTCDRILELREVVERMRNDAISIQKKIASKCPPM